MNQYWLTLIQYRFGVPTDILKIIKSFDYHVLDNDNIRYAVALWIHDKNKCLINYGHIKKWNTRRITDMDALFYHEINFDEDISKWDVSNVTTMSHMFYNCYKFNGDLTFWNVSNVTNMSNMFYGCTS